MEVAQARPLLELVQEQEQEQGQGVAWRAQLQLRPVRRARTQGWNLRQVVTQRTCPCASYHLVPLSGAPEPSCASRRPYERSLLPGAQAGVQRAAAQGAGGLGIRSGQGERWYV